MARPLVASISLSALAQNLRRARSCAPRSRVWSVVKADAYGHGLARALRGFADADGMALVEFDRALELRRAGWRRPILMLEGAFDRADVELALREGLSLVIHQSRQIDWIERSLSTRKGASDLGMDLHLKFDSGMNRLGFDATGLRAARTRLRAMRGAGGLASLTLMTHFANSDLPGGVEPALARFDEACRGFDEPRSASNSAAVLACPAAHVDWIRPGIMLYGGTPFADRPAAALGLRAAMHLESELIAVRELEPGDTVGYGSTFRAPSAMRVGVVACGYADGYPRHAPAGTPVLVDGRRAGLVGRVSMDMITVDLTGIDSAAPGTRVELWGDHLPIDEVALAAGTIGYELMCALAPRVAVRVLD